MKQWLTEKLKGRNQTAGDAIPLDVSASDSDFPGTAWALVIGTAGDVEVTTLAGRKVVLPNVPAGVLPLEVKTVHTANTTATDISALF